MEAIFERRKSMENDKKIKELLENEIKSEFENLKTLKPGSPEHTESVDSIAKLYKLNTKSIEKERDSLVKEAQLEEEKCTRYCKLGVDAMGIVLPLIFYGIWMKKGFKFEETGVFTSTTFKGLFNKFRPR